jgi:hypothetical protein
LNLNTTTSVSKRRAVMIIEGECTCTHSEYKQTTIGGLMRKTSAMRIAGS